MRSRRATLTVSGHFSSHLTGVELEEESADVGFMEEAADTVEEERPRSKEGVLSNPVVI
jgi:hypothetical protein